MFDKILIANRGEIACRIHATARKLAIKTVAIYSDTDAHAKHVRLCDQAVALGGSSARDSYLRGDRIIAAALATGAQAIHPGYGFLSENAEFAQACADAGLVFIGPPASAIAAMGGKAQAKQLMQQAGVPLVPGYHGDNQDAAFLQQQADAMGYPVLLKASAGGGGKGMRVVDRAADFAAALASCQREAQSSFGNSRVLLEKYLLRPRHIEIQVFGDQHGNYVHLFERDCSVQRRHQKVLEEAPAPGLSDAIRSRMGEAALAAARAVGYVGAGTVEFIVETLTEATTAKHSDGAAATSVGADLSGAGQPQAASAPSGGSVLHEVKSVGAFYFMEMNTRLQVEHPVTEAITGLDLVEWQLRVASGEPLPLAQHQLKIHGHAIEARICAENPDQQYMPATGQLAVYEKPAHCSFARGPLRFDDGVRADDQISPYYDSMIAKLIVHAHDRAQALAQLDAALAQTHIVGLHNNVQFLRHVVRSPSFAQARLDTGLIGREEAVLFHQDPVGLPLSVAAAVAYTLAQESMLAGPDPWSERDHWNSHGPRTRQFAFQYGAHSCRAALQVLHKGLMVLQVGDHSGPLHWDFEHKKALKSNRGIDITLSFLEQNHKLQIYRVADEINIFAPQGASRITVVDLLAHQSNQHADAGRLTAPMPGRLVSFAVAEGAKVQAGQTLAVIEAMKMEHSITAPQDGTVAELLYAPGDQLTEGAELLRLEAA